MDLDAFSLAKQFVHVGEARVAYRDEGTGPPVVLLHGCPFSTFVLWAWSRLLWGGKDPHFGPPWAERLAADIPGVERVEVLADAGHLLMEDQPERVTECLVEFLTSPAPTPDPVQLDTARP